MLHIENETDQLMQNSWARRIAFDYINWFRITNEIAFNQRYNKQTLLNLMEKCEDD